MTASSQARRERRLIRKFHLERTLSVKLTYADMQTLYHAIRQLDAVKDRDLSVKTMVALGRNMKAIKPYVEALEKKISDVTVREGAVLDPTINARVEQAMRNDMAEEVDVELHVINARDLNLERNKISAESIMGLMPMLQGLEEIG